MEVQLVVCLLSALLATASGGVVNVGMLQSCVNSMFSLIGRLDFELGGGVYVRILSQICGETNCNVAEYKNQPKISAVPNGLQCPSCYALGAQECLQKDTLACHGGANQCIYIVGRLSEENVEIPFAAAGCASKDADKIQAGYILQSAVFIYQITKIELSPATRMETADGS